MYYVLYEDMKIFVNSLDFDRQTPNLLHNSLVILKYLCIQRFEIVKEYEQLRSIFWQN